jgi:hypothetical protein
VAMAVLFTLVGFQRSRTLGALAPFALAIPLGSVHLSRHYAIDGYAAILSVLVIWWIAGSLASPLTRGNKLPFNGDLQPTSRLHAGR